MITGNTFFMPWEVDLIVWIQQHLSSVGVALFSFFTFLGSEIVIVAMCCFLYWCYDKEYGKYVGTNIVMVNLVAPMIKNVVFRRRPYFDHESISCLKPVSNEGDLHDIAVQGFSFPSAHSMNAMTLFGSMAAYPGSKLAKGDHRDWVKPLLSVLAVLMPLLIGVSRFALGVHYPTDVLIGWIGGLLIILLVPRLQSRFRDRRIFWLILCLIGAIGFFYCKTDDYFTGYGLMLGYFSGIAFEEKYVHFKNSPGVLASVIRFVVGLAGFLILGALLKMPFSPEFLKSGSLAAHLVRTGRYTVLVFFAVGLYPMLFRLWEKN